MYQKITGVPVIFMLIFIPTDSKTNNMNNKSKKTLFLMSGTLTGIVFVSSMLDANSGSFFGSVWLFRLGWLLMSISSLISYYNIKKSEKGKN